MMRLASLQYRVEMLKEASFRLDRQGPSIPPRFANKVKALTGCNISEISVRDYDGENVGRRMTSFGGYSLFTEEGSLVLNTDPPTGDCRDYVILRMPSHFKSAAYNAGKKPLDFSKPWTLTIENLKARLTYLQRKQNTLFVSRTEAEEMVKIRKMMRNNRYNR